MMNSIHYYQLFDYICIITVEDMVTHSLPVSCLGFLVLTWLKSTYMSFTGLTTSLQVKDFRGHDFRGHVDNIGTYTRCSIRSLQRLKLLYCSVNLFVGKYKKIIMVKVPISCLGMSHICYLWILLRRNIIYLVARKCYLRGLFCC